jgi:hypothetical protein
VLIAVRWFSQVPADKQVASAVVMKGNVEGVELGQADSVIPGTKSSRTTVKELRKKSERRGTTICKDKEEDKRVRVSPQIGVTQDWE